MGSPNESSRSAMIVAVLATAGVVVSLMQSLVIPIIPHLPVYLNARPDDTAWVITATLLAASVAVPTVGRLGDMLGKRRLLLISIVLMIAGSVVGALSSSVLPMIVGRALQGLATGVIPLGMSVMRDVLPRERLAGAVAVMSASLGVGGALGLPLAAVIAEYTSWHMLFWVSALLGLACFVAVRAVVPESSYRAAGGFDYVGSLGMSVGLVALLLGVSKGGAWGWGSVVSIACFVTAAACFAAWTYWELRVSAPLVDLRVSVRRQVLLTNAASIVFGFAMFVISMVLPQVVQLPVATGYGLGRSMLVAGLVMAPMGVMVLCAAPLSSLITNTFGPKATLMLGATVVAAGYGFGAFMLHAEWQLVATGVVVGGGTGLAYGAMPALIMSAVPTTQTGAANSLNSLMRALGTSFASAVSGVLVAQMTMDVGGVSLPTEGAFRSLMLIAAVASAAALLIACSIPRQHGFGSRSPVQSHADHESVGSAA